MKKLFKVLGIAAALATVLGFGMIGCSDDSYDEAVVKENLNPSTDALWDFSTKPVSGITSSEGPVSGTVKAERSKGASLTIDGRGSWDSSNKMIQAGANTITLATATKAKLKFDLHLAAKSTVTLLVSVPGGDDPKRVVAVTKKDSEAIISDLSATTPALPNTKDKSKAIPLASELAAGDYTIWLNSACIYSITAKSADFKAHTKYLLNDADVDPTEPEKELGIEARTGIAGKVIAYSTNPGCATITLGDVKKIDGVAVNKSLVTITSKKAGETIFYIATDIPDNGKFSSKGVKATVNEFGEIKLEVATGAAVQFTPTSKSPSGFNDNLKINSIEIKEGADVVEVDGSDSKKVKSVGIGTAVITVKDDAGNAQDVSVTVSQDGKTFTFVGGTGSYIEGTASIDYGKIVVGATETLTATAITKTYGTPVTFGALATCNSNKKIELTSKKAGKGTITITGTVGSTNVIIPVNVEVTSEGVIKLACTPWYICPFFNATTGVTRICSLTFPKDSDGKYVSIDAKNFLTADIDDTNDSDDVKTKKNAVLAMGRKIGAAATDEPMITFVNGTDSNAKIKVEALAADKGVKYKYGDPENGTEYTYKARLSTGAKITGAKTAIKIVGLKANDYVAVVFASGSDDASRGISGLGTAISTDTADFTRTSTGSGDLKLFIEKVSNDGDYYLNYDNSIYIYSIEIYK